MEMITDLIGAGASIASGGLFGLFGSVVGQVSKYFQRKQEFREKQAEWAHELKLQELQMQARAEETEQEVAIADTRGSWEGMRASYQATFQPQSAWAKDLKALVRPTLTFALWGLAVFVFVWISRQGAEAYLTGDETAAIVRYMIYTVFFTASSATMWWFGDRALAPPQMKHL